MSTAKKKWSEVEESSTNGTTENHERVYTEIFGHFFPKGIDISSQVIAKLKLGDFENIWPTLLQADGMDSGLSAGYMTALGVCPIDQFENYRDTLADALGRISSGVEILFEDINTFDELAQYPEYTKYPEEQAWMLPGVMIHYHPTDSSL